MVKGKGSKLGDTLVEVTLAIGIFSMVAIAAVSVISASTSSTQNVLENTITREHIDSQAEALRFIQAAYAAEGERDPSNPTKYSALWEAISQRAIDLEDSSDDIKDIITNYNPTTCSELYDPSKTKSLIRQKAFLININAIGATGSITNIVNNVIVKPNESNMSPFVAASTFPRIVYQSTNSGNSLYDPGETSNIINGINSNIIAAEGLFIVAVKDSSGTTIISDGANNTSISAYIDFYIRSCWYSTGAKRPSTISTVIRLYNPDTVAVNKYERKGVIINYDKGAEDATGSMPSQYILAGKTAALLENRFERPGYTFIGWTDGYDDCLIDSDDLYCEAIVDSSLAENGTVTLTALWARYDIKYHTNSTWSWGDKKYGESSDQQDCNKFTGCRLITAADTARGKELTRSGYKFLGWCTLPIQTVGVCDGTVYQPGDDFPGPLDSTAIDLYAIWEYENRTLAIIARWNNSADYESNLIGWKSNGTSFTAYYGATTMSDIDNTPIAILHQDCTSNCGDNDEIFVINTLGGRDYYYYLCRYSGGICGSSVSTSSGVTVSVYIKDEDGDVDLTIGGNAGNTYNGKYILEKTFNIASAAGSTSGRYWNVFAYKDGQIVTPEENDVTVISNSINTSY